MRICQWRDGCTKPGTEFRSAGEGEDRIEAHYCPDHAAEVDARIKDKMDNVRFLLMAATEPVLQQKVEEPEDQ